MADDYEMNRTWAEVEHVVDWAETVVDGATHTVSAGDVLLHVTYTATGAVTITLPSTWISTPNMRLIIKDAGLLAGTNNISIATEGAETIDGAASLTLSNNGQAITLYTYDSNVFAY